MRQYGRFALLVVLLTCAGCTTAPDARCLSSRPAWKLNDDQPTRAKQTVAAGRWAPPVNGRWHSQLGELVVTLNARLRANASPDAVVGARRSGIGWELAEDAGFLRVGGIGRRQVGQVGDVAKHLRQPLPVCRRHPLNVGLRHAHHKRVNRRNRVQQGRPPSTHKKRPGSARFRQHRHRQFALQLPGLVRPVQSQRRSRSRSTSAMLPHSARFCLVCALCGR